MPDTTLPSPSDRLAMMLWHIGVAHRIGARGRIAFASETAAGWNEGLVANSSRALREHLAADDPQYLSQHRFSFRRHTGCVEAVCSAWLDLDFRGVDRKGKALPFAEHNLDEVVAIVLYVVAAAGLPAPSYITDSGTGCHVVWTLRGLDKMAMKRWRALMKALLGPCLDEAGNPRPRCGRREPDAYELAWTERMLPLWRTLKDLGLDRNVSDPARVLRLWGSVSPKNGRLVRCAWPACFGDIHSADFNALCDAALPLTRAQLRALREERKAAREANPDAAPAPRTQSPRRATGSKWRLVLDDLMALREHRGAAWFKENRKRDIWCMLAAVALSQIEGGDAQSWAEHLGPLVGQPVAELAVALSGVERGMHAHAASETVEFEGKVRPAFYAYAPAKIAEKLLVTDAEARELGLRIVRPAGLPAMTPAERQQASRNRRDPHRAIRVRSKAEMLRPFALAMREAGYSAAEIAEAIGCARSTVYAILSDSVSAQADAVETVPASTPSPDISLGVSDGCHAPSIVPPGSHPASTPSVPRTLPRAAQQALSAPRAVAPPPVAARRIPADRSSAPPSPLAASSGTGSHGRRPDRPRVSNDFVLTVMAMLRIEEARDRRRAAGAAERRAASAPSMPLAPLDPSREADLYREASGGGGFRHRRGLVAA